ncbi:tyrosine-type recombinase/integrase [Mesorhizobium sp. PL10]
MRHTMATKLLWLGVDITDVQRFLGHKNIEMTRHYAETTAATLRRKSIRSRTRPSAPCFQASGTFAVMRSSFERSRRRNHHIC